MVYLLDRGRVMRAARQGEVPSGPDAWAPSVPSTSGPGDWGSRIPDAGGIETGSAVCRSARHSPMSVSRQAARGAGDRRSDGLDAHLAFTERYRGLVNEPDPEIRRSVIQDVGTPDGANDTRSSEAVGDGTLGARVTSAGDSFVRIWKAVLPQQYRSFWSSRGREGRAGNGDDPGRRDCAAHPRISGSGRSRTIITDPQFIVMSKSIS
jgi:hypothetical protein